MIIHSSDIHDHGLRFAHRHSYHDKTTGHRQWWSYLPLTRTQVKSLACAFATSQSSPTPL
jgi:hypothetical protein